MPSIFEYVSKKMVKNIGGKDLRPVKCLLDATKFRQLNVLRKNSQSRFWEQPDDNPVGFSLMDILEPSSSAPEAVVLGTYLFSDTKAQKQEIGGDISAGVEGSVSGNFAQFHGPTLEIQAVSIPDPKLETLQNRKLLHPEPSFLTECRMRGDNLYVVTEAIELTKDTVLQEGSRVETLGKLSSPWSTYVKGKVWGQSLKARETKLSVPQGTVLAYRKKQLVIRKQVILLVSADAKQKTFQDVRFLKMENLSLLSPGWAGACSLGVPPKDFTMRSSSVSFSFPSPLGSAPGPEAEPWRGVGTCRTENPETGRIEEPLHQDFQLLQEEVSCNTALLAQLSKDVQAVIFHSILSLLGDREALCGLTNMLELDRLGQMEGPGGIILDELCQGTRPPWIDLKSLILYLLQALMVLSDTHLDLLALSMEKGILLHQRELVRSILQPNFKYPWCIPLTLQPQLLAPLQAEGLAIMYGLLEECGLKMELNNYKPSWDLEAKMPMSALYGALSLLQQLAED
uniref:gasdermin-C n=1 Tax=Jaculus jaculus TaxID=51337 RepID=UPI001E1AFF32|nr:gasdermin-C [Jaculus jaculus]